MEHLRLGQGSRHICWSTRLPVSTPEHSLLCSRTLQQTSQLVKQESWVFQWQHSHHNSSPGFSLDSINPPLSVREQVIAQWAFFRTPVFAGTSALPARVTGCRLIPTIATTCSCNSRKKIHTAVYTSAREKHFQSRATIFNISYPSSWYRSARLPKPTHSYMFFQLC